MRTQNAFILRLVRCFLLSPLLLFGPLFSLDVHAEITHPIIGEVAWAGSSLSSADEWLELWNTSDNIMSLDGWSLQGASSNPLPFPPGAAIPAHGTYMIANYASKETNSVLAFDADFVTTALSLSNSQLKIELLDPNGAVVDTAGNGGAPPAGSSSSIKIAMVRIDPLSLENIAWTAATTSQNLKLGTSDLGTPGVCDFCGSTSSEETGSTTTSTKDVPVTATSTQDIRINDASATTTDLAATTTADLPLNTSTSTTEMAASSTPPILLTATTSTSTPSTATTPTPTSAEKPKPNFHMLRLNEIAPYPSSGKEWIEVVTMDRSQKINLRGCTIHDANSVIHTIGNKSIDPLTSPYTSFFLPKALLENAGGSISLYAPDGTLIDILNYNTTPKGNTWIRFPDMDGNWRLTASSTQGMPNAFVQASTLPEAPSVGAPPPPSTSEISDVQLTTSSDGPEEIPEIDPIDEAITQTPPTTPTQTTTTKTVAPTKKPASPKTTKKTAAVPAPIRITFDMTTQDSLANIRVYLTGHVGSQSGLLSGHTFILQNPDGRGLLVSVPTKLRLPPMGSDVSVTGSLHIDDKGAASLKMETKDTLLAQPTSTKPIPPRLVDLLAPAVEDAWSLVQVTGTVTDVKTSTVHLDLGDAEVDVLIKPLIRYRAKRLVAGDVIAVTGLLDLTHDDPRIIPRTAEEITMVQHAAPKTAASATPDISPQSPILPGWAPVGAAAGAIVVTEGAKHINRRRKIRSLEKRLAQF